MCRVLMKIKPSSRFAPDKVFVPCGKCPECLASLKNAWSWRLRAEFEDLKRRGWRVGFFTLTYNDENLPHFTSSAFAVPTDDKVACFSRIHVRKFIDNIRKHLWREYDITTRRDKDAGIRYMVCSEYGPSTQRPHYHGVIAWPSKWRFERRSARYGQIGELTGQKMHELIKRYWPYGFVGPKDFRGAPELGISAFEVQGSAAGCAIYAAKYCCKDFSFSEHLSRYQFAKDSPAYRVGKQFHLQSRSLGLVALKRLSNDEKLDLYLNGKSFVGSDKLLPIPLYIRNKLLFDNYYIISGDRRLCRRKASQFFKENALEIFTKKTDFYSSLFSSACSPSFWIARGFECAKSSALAQLVENYLKVTEGSRIAAERFLCYYGVPNENCFASDVLSAWLSRYDSDYAKNAERFRLMPLSLLRANDSFCSFFFDTLSSNEVHSLDDLYKLGEFVKDFYSNQFTSFL